MKQMIRTMSVIFGVVLVATFFALNTNAQCGASDGQVTTAAATSLLERSAPLRNASQTRAQPAVSQQRKTEEVSIVGFWQDRKSTRLNSSHRCISYAVFCLKKKNKKKTD